MEWNRNLNRRDFVKWTVGSGILLPAFAHEHIANLLRDNSEYEHFLHPLAKPLERDPISGEVTQMSLGENASVWIDRKNGFVKREFRVDAICSGGIKPLQNSAARLKAFYRREKITYLKLRALGSRFIPANVEFDDERQTITMPYYGSDLLTRMMLVKSWRPSDTAVAQIVEMHHEYREAGIFKRNVAASNLYLDESTGRLLAGDFKEARPRRMRFLWREIQKPHLWLTKISRDLPRMLEPTFADFSLSWIRSANEFCAKAYAGGVPLRHDDEVARGVIYGMIESARGPSFRPTAPPA